MFVNIRDICVHTVQGPKNDQMLQQSAIVAHCGNHRCGSTCLSIMPSAHTTDCVCMRPSDLTQSPSNTFNSQQEQTGEPSGLAVRQFLKPIQSYLYRSSLGGG